MTSWRFFLPLTLVFFVTPTAEAQLIAYDGFDYPVTGTYVVLDGAGGGTATGWDTGPEMRGGDCATFTGGHTGAGWVTSIVNRTAARQNRVVATGLTYPMLATSPGMGVLIDGAAVSGGVRSFRTVDTSSAAAVSVRTSTGMIGAGEVWIAFLGNLDARTAMSTTSVNGGMHLFQEIGDIDACPDGPKHPFEHLQFMDRNTANTWTVARTTGGGPGAATFDTPIPFDHTTHLHVVRIRFDHSASCTSPSAPCSACPASSPTCNEEVTLFMDPDLSAAGTPADSTATVGPVNMMDFVFNTIEVGAEGEWIDIDELRIGTTFDSVTPRLGSSPDAGTPMLDAGTPPTDAGTSGMDSGTPASDSGTPAVDSGTPASDSGTPAVDSGAPAVDSGAPVGDSGTSTSDSGAPVDASPRSDAGPGTAGGGCCSVARPAGAPPVPLVLALPLLLLRFRRRAR